MRTVVYCLDMETCHTLMGEAIAIGLKITQEYPTIRPTSFEVHSSASDEAIADQFLNSYANNPNVGIFYDERHPKCDKDTFRPSVATAPRPLQAPRALILYASGVPSVIRPDTMATWYNFPTYTPSGATPKPKIGIVSLGGYYQPSDLTQYWIDCGLTGSIVPTVTDVQVEIYHPIPKFTQSIESIENTLDIELAGAMCRNARIAFFSTANTQQGMLDAVTAAISSGMNMISISWGSPEPLFYAISSGIFMTALDNQFQIAVSSGIVVTAAAGDFGSSDNYYTTYTVSGYPVKVPVPHLDFPASSPSVVACGGTSLYKGVVNAETAWIDGGGGQSTRFLRPSYQGAWDPAWPIDPFTKRSSSGTPFARTIPDISFNSDPNSHWTIRFAGYVDDAYGTSCSAPLMAGLLGRFYGLSASGRLPRRGYAPSGFNYFMYNAPSSTRRKITYGQNIRVQRDPIIRAINPFGLQVAPANQTYYKIFTSGAIVPSYTFCTGLGVPVSNQLFNYLNSIVCVSRGTQIKMSDGTQRPIETLKRGDEVLGYEGACYRIATVNRQCLSPTERLDLIEILSHALGPDLPSRRLIITSNHPIFYQETRRPAKCFGHLQGVQQHKDVLVTELLESETISNLTGDAEYILYDLQFDEDGSYTANGVVVQSRSPWSDLTPLPEELYFDTSRYHEKRHWDSLYHILPLDDTDLEP